MLTKIYGNVVTKDSVIEDGVVVIENETIVYAGTQAALPLRWNEGVIETFTSENGYILPGFIDIHVHGGGGEDFMNSDENVLDTITSYHASQGTTTMLATTMTAPKDWIEKVLSEVNKYRSKEMPYAQLAGVHLEGPFISPKWPGAQNPEHISLPNVDWLISWEQQYPELVRQVTLAPEQQGAHEVIAWLKDKEIIAALGHTDATYEEVEAAVEVGLHHAVHTFNAMTPLHHRKPGVAGAVLSDERISAEVIADGIHVHPAAVSLLAQLKSKLQKLVLITDAISATGLEDGNYTLGDLPVIVKEGVARLEDGVTLAGSTLTMIRGFRFLVQEAGLDIIEASQAASHNPAELLGILDATGTIEQGKQADLLLLDDSLQLKQVWIKGRALSMDSR
ncbi:N-acetylglucosamine-6-phosphate deacetylase [Paenibacillus urinalis]|uniref:N-acetylglucosamine-6-phosphate deacetylase n=1 Tax=Paenibacillus urinalis TaxID=521520 RepID=A0AAX3MXU4_9BACL|nr:MULTISPECIES: N-acetylglucosamine-6-phosphate deacetylase [Paenibacillus]WDH81863.1 N-acetylglucosamine-6-phosphate deacetylase [Paenibacillus urinalis]WDH97913.1 N-acetylglucosamine-6-phosphate deacetylase [Paenibacillus urinalis]GAK42610.1 N-acetylglucosamine-6-phosphate deacetylase [Paenibacillus sp. TCA20]